MATSSEKFVTFGDLFIYFCILGDFLENSDTFFGKIARNGIKGGNGYLQ